MVAYARTVVVVVRAVDVRWLSASESHVNARKRGNVCRILRWKHVAGSVGETVAKPIDGKSAGNQRASERVAALSSKTNQREREAINKSSARTYQIWADRRAGQGPLTSR